VKEQRLIPEKILLQPGRYFFVYTEAMDFPKTKPTSQMDSVDLEAGHSYEVIGRFCNMTGGSAAWIEDLTTHQVVSGSRECNIEY
jgi:hypothetical protein